MSSQAKTLLNLSLSSLQGPHGVPASKTLKSVEILHDMLTEILDILNKVNPAFVPKLEVNSVLTLMNENLHSILRLRVETPSVLDCARDFIRGVLELIKKRTLCGFHYFTSKKSSEYEIPRGTLLFQNLLKIKPEIPVKLSRDDVKLLLEYRERFGKGVRQRSVRADTTKYNAGTLPLHLYDNRPLPNCSNIEFTQQQLENPQDQSEQSVSTETPALQDSVSSLYLVDDYLAIVLEGNICIGRILSTVNEKSTTCSLKIYTEDSGLIYNTSCEGTVPIDQVLLLLPTNSYSVNIKDDTITLAEEQYCDLKKI